MTNESLERAVKAFIIKKNEITVAAVDELEKLQKHLLFVSLQDYNKVLEENKRLKLLVMDWGKEEPKPKKMVPLDIALKVTGMTEQQFLSFRKENKIKYRHNGKYMYFDRQDILKNLTKLKGNDIIKM